MRLRVYWLWSLHGFFRLRGKGLGRPLDLAFIGGSGIAPGLVQVGVRIAEPWVDRQVGAGTVGHDAGLRDRTDADLRIARVCAAAVSAADHVESAAVSDAAERAERDAGDGCGS